MPKAAANAVTLSSADARRIWLRAQRLDAAEPFGAGAGATVEAVKHLGYVQIDTINVVERCHHHILFSRIPSYERAHLRQAQSVDKSVFEYWAHALAYLPTCDLPYHLPEMRRHRRAPNGWLASVTPQELRKVMALVRKDGALSIRDIDDDALVEKDHPWASRKPSRRALQMAFFSGALAVSARSGMLKTYELMERHFGWARRPQPASARQVAEYRLDRALRAQGFVSLDSICHLAAAQKAVVRRAIEARARLGALVPVALAGHGRVEHWAMPEALETPAPAAPLVHILSPFDPLIIQRKRLEMVFGYAHRFEAYVPKEKRVMGYFALPVLVGDAVVAAIDLKADRQRRSLLVQQWNWIGKAKSTRNKALIEEALGRFERFQFGD